MEAGFDAGTTPAAVATAFATAVAERDPEAAGALLSTEGRLLLPDGTEVRGKAQTREALARLVTMSPLTRVEPERVLGAGELALAFQRWTLCFEGAGVPPFEQALMTSLLLIRDSAGWRVLVAAPRPV